MSAPLEAGQIINRTYTIQAPIGAGAFGEVYLVSHRFLGRQAMKVLKVEADTRFEDLLLEARLLVDLTHPHIVRVYDANVCDEFTEPFAFISMEYARIGTLASLIGSKTRLSDSFVLSVGLQVAAALSHTHSRHPPLLHRDVKPSNILVFDDGDTPLVKLSDYGLASCLDPETRLTHSGGTIAFAPPEMAWGVADERGDVYGVGVTLYRALTSIHPFPLTSPEELSASRQFRHALSYGRKSIPPPSKMLMRRPTELDSVIMQCLEFDMFARFKNATELLAALSELGQLATELPRRQIPESGRLSSGD